MDDSRTGTRPDATERKAAAAVCRRCNRSIDETNEHYPFCSERCRLADLNSWFDGDYKVSREIKDSDIETVD
ncbi:MAG: DNA gyrase inhibitor YacG [Phycisphaerales bacterium]